MRVFVSIVVGSVLLIGVASAFSRDHGVAAGTTAPTILEHGAPGPTVGAAARSGYLVVKFRAATSAAEAARLHAAVGATIEKAQPRSGLQRLRLPHGANRDAAVAAYRRSPLVEEAAIGHVAAASDAPNDTNYPYQWTMHSTTGGMHAEGAWPMSPAAGAGVVVSVIDTGAPYEDFTGPGGLNVQTFRRAPDLMQTAFVHPYDFYNNDTHANDDNGHGSHVTGTIAQDTNNAYGVAGVAPGVTIMPLKVLAFDGTGFDDDVAEAIYWAVDHGARVINMSLGFTDTGAPDANGNYCTEIAGLGAALDFAHAAGVVVVAAAGNDNGIVSCPAAYPSVIAVGSTRFDGARAYYSNTGATLDVTAPGGDDTVDQNGDGFYDGALQETYCYDWLTLLFLGTYDQFCDVFYVGTSMASPHVAGVAALLMGEQPALTPAQVRTYIESTARDRGVAGWDATYGWGAVDAEAALAALLGASSTPTSTATPTNTPAPPTSTRTPTSTPAPSTNTSTPTSTPAPAQMHVGDIDGAASKKGNSWTAKVTVHVHTASHAAVGGATVTASWSGGAPGAGTCTTDRRGRCTITSAKLPLGVASVTLAVTGVSHSGYAYESTANHDPDGSSNGTTIVVMQ